jgi:hypothetical protein
VIENPRDAFVDTVAREFQGVGERSMLSIKQGAAQHIPKRRIDESEQRIGMPVRSLEQMKMARL